MICIGVDFDNTIVTYDSLFHKVALENGYIPEHIPVNKTSVRNYLREAEQEDIWTEMQGYIYGSRMTEAEAFPGVKSFFRWAMQSDIPIKIISHKTLYPYRGKKYNLHLAAQKWLEVQGFFDKEQIGLDQKMVFFNQTKMDKMECIRNEKCTHFIDDLPEFLTETNFPENVDRILFDPKRFYSSIDNMKHLFAWDEILEYFKRSIRQ